MESVEQINREIRFDPRGFVERCDARYGKELDQAAQRIAENWKSSPIILLSGPSASGKTGAARLLSRRLETMGLRTHSVSMADYLLNIDPETSPRNIRGEIDYESPFCMDLDLLNRHIAMLEQGQTVHVPYFDMAAHCRSLTQIRQLTLGKDELVIFEGLHALNDYIAGKNPKALKIFIHLGEDYCDDPVQLLRPQLRFCRRIVRDTLLRGVDPDFTVQQWRNVRRGELLYSAPFAGNADLVLDSFLPYEMSALRPLAQPLLERLCANWGDDAEAIVKNLRQFEPLERSYLSECSPVREFICKEENADG